MINNNSKHRQIRVFVSSTFQDMQAERDYLMTKTFPRLRRIASDRNVSLVEVDLRWGITKEEEGQSGKVVYTCLNEIENSHPFFIGILGNRYGWCPSERDLMQSKDFSERYGWIGEDVRDGMSITEIEFQYGALRSKEPINAFFFLKREDKQKSLGFLDRFFSSKNKLKLERLKKEIRENKRFPWSYYSQPEDLGQQVESAFLNLLDSLYPQKVMTEDEKIRLSQTILQDSLRQIYIRQEDNHKELTDFINIGIQTLVIAAPSGMGKSALLANWIADEQQAGCVVIGYFVGDLSQGHHQIVNYFIHEICRIYGLSIPDQQNTIIETWKCLLNDSRVKNRPPVLVIDGLNELSDEGDEKELYWLTNLPTHVKLIVSTHVEDITYKVLKEKCASMFDWHIMSDDARYELVVQYLKRHSKELEQYQLKRILEAPLTKNPLILRSLIDELMVFGVYERLDERIDYYLCSNNVQDFFQAVLKRCSNDYDPQLVFDGLCLLAVSRDGLSEPMLLSVINRMADDDRKKGRDVKNVTQLQWSQFRCAFENNLLLRNGRLTFSHSYIRQAVEQRYLNIESRVVFYRSVLADYIYQNKPVSASEWQYSVNELTFQFLRLKYWQPLFQIIGTYQYFNMMFEQERLQELSSYWKMLMNVDSAKYSPHVYLDDLFQTNKLNGGLDVQAKACQRIGVFCEIFLTNRDLAQEFYKKGLDINVEDDAAKSMNMLQKAHDLIDEKQYDEAEALLNQKYEADRSRLGDNHPLLIVDGNEIAHLKHIRGLYDEALEWYQKGVSQASADLSNRENFGYCVSLSGIAQVYESRLQIDDAIPYYKEAAEATKMYYGQYNKSVADLYEHIAQLYFFKLKNQNNEGINDYLNLSVDFASKCLEILKKVEPEVNHSNRPASLIVHGFYEVGHEQLGQTSTSLIKLHQHYVQKGDFEKAVDYGVQAVEMLIKENKEDTEDLARAAFYTASAFSVLKQYDQTLKYIEIAMSFYSQHSGESNSLEQVYLSSLGQCYYEKGRALKGLQKWKDAKESLTYAINIFLKTLAKNNPLLAVAYNELATCHQYLHQFKDAVPLMLKAVEFATYSYGASNEKMLIYYKNTANAYYLVGDKENEKKFTILAENL